MGKCTCDRSPTGQCIGWHSLTQEEYEVKKKEYEDTISESKRQKSTKED